MPELQTIPARHGVATYVPAGQVIKIINSSGSQVIDTWAFALPKPDPKKSDEKQEEGEKKDEKGEQKGDESKTEEKEKEPEKPAPTPKKGKKGSNDLPTQEEAEKATRDGLSQGETAAQDASKGTPQKSTWSSYVPSLGLGGKGGAQKQQDKEQQKKNSKGWASYFPSGQGFSNYVPKSASDTVASFASSHQRDPNKSYLEQLQDFSKTPVGAAGIKGLAAFSGSGYGGSLYAGYQAYNAAHANDVPPMEFMSMAHSRSASLHLRPKVNDVLVSNLREPMLTVVEDTSPGIHDTLVAACDPYRYRQLGVDHWEEHGSCAENLVLALKELNERAGLKGAKGIGADVTINNVPAPLNLFMNIPWDEEGDIGFKAPKTKEGDFIRLKAERDVVVVMSACPQDVLEINNKKPTDANFLVEGDENSADAVKRTQTPRKRPPPRKINSSAKPPSTVATGDMGDDDKSNVGSTPAKKPVPKRAPVKKPAPAQQNGPAKTNAAPKKKPIPRPAATPSKAAGNATAGAANNEGTNGSATPVEKKKPRKLVRPTPAAES